MCMSVQEMKAAYSKEVKLQARRNATKRAIAEEHLAAVRSSNRYEEAVQERRRREEAYAAAMELYSEQCERIAKAAASGHVGFRPAKKPQPPKFSWSDEYLRVDESNEEFPAVLISAETALEAAISKMTTKQP